MQRFFVWFFCLLIPIVPLSAQTVEVDTLTGTRKGNLTGISTKDGSLVLTLDGSSEFPCDSIKSLRFPDHEAMDLKEEPFRFFFWNEDWWHGTPADAPVEMIGIDFAPYQSRPVEDERKVTVPLEGVRAIATPRTASAWSRFRETHLAGDPPAEDLLIPEDGGSQSGFIDSITAEKVVMSETELGTLPLEWKDIDALLIAPIVPPKEPGDNLLARVHLVDGSRLTGTIKKLDPTSLRIDLPYKKDFEVPTTAVRTIHFLGGRFVYLSDLEPTAVDEHGILLSTHFPYQKDREVCEKEPLKLDGTTYSKGLGVHAYSSLTYALEGKYREFRTVIGIDDVVDELATDLAPEGPTVVFRVLVDGKQKAEVTMTGRDPARELAIDVSGAKKLELVVDAGPETFETLARADWADAHLVK